MAATPKVVIKKTMPYQGGVKEWSNAYHFSGGTPADNSHWNTLFDNIVADEADILMSDCTITEAVGYNAGSSISAHNKTYTTAGTYSPGSTRDLSPGAVAALVRFSTAARSSKGHPVYLFNYYHRVVTDPGVADPDTLLGTYKTALEEYADDWLAGFSDGTNTYVRSGPNGADATARYVHPYATHRDFPS